MDHFEISSLAHEAHPVAAPVSDRRVAQLIGGLAPPAAGTVLDLGCGQGAWLLASATAHPAARHVGVDISVPALAKARTRAERQGADVRWVQADAAQWDEGPHDAVLCVGASHIFGGLGGTLAAVRRSLRPGGRVLLGDTIWERPPSEAAQQAVAAGPGDFPNVAGLVERVCAQELEVIDGHVSTLEEWDDYEWAWTGALIQWATSGNGTEADRTVVLEAARGHRSAWLGGYRQQLGFACLVLQDLRVDER